MGDDSPITYSIDSWFEKVPGGYYKPKSLPQDSKPAQSNMTSRQQQPRRRYNDDYASPPPSRGYSGRSSGEQRRNDSHRSPINRYDSDDEPYDDSHRPRAPRDDRYYPDEPSRQSRARYDGDNQPDRAYPKRSSPRRDPDRPVSPFTAAAAAVAGVEAANSVNDRKTSASREPPADQYDGYVPYSNIYGNNTHPPAPQSTTGSVQPTQFNQITTSRRNPMSPDPSVLDGALSPHHAYDQRYPESYDERYHDERYDRYPDDHDYYDRRDARPSRPRMRRRSFEDSYDSRDAYYRSPSPRRSNNADGRSSVAQKPQRARGKSTSRIGDTFDKSQRGLGYSAVGALAGGLVGSEVGKGSVPAAIGAVLGGLGANMFEARERKKGMARNVDHPRDEDLGSRRRERNNDRRVRDERSPG